MIHEVGVELFAKLKAVGCPLPVVDGPERTKPATGARERIVIEHDEKEVDSFGPPKSQHTRPAHRMTRVQAWKLTIYAQSSTAGAEEFEHRRRADNVLDVVLVALGNVALARHNTFVPRSGSFIAPEDLAESERIAGAVYELKFTWDRGVVEKKFDGTTRPIAPLTGVASTTKVSRAQEAPLDEIPNDAETACGT